MKKAAAGLIGFCAVILALSLAGCWRYSDGAAPVVMAPQPPLVENELTTVKLVLNGGVGSPTLRGAGAPEVTFQLKLLDAGSAGNPVVLLQKKVAATLVADKYQAEAEFVGVAALPAIARVSIAGGYVVDAADGKHYSSWVGMKDLVDGVANEITLYGEGGRSSADVGVNLLEKLIVVPANVATLPTPVVATINTVVAGLNLSSPTVYDDALQAFNSQYGITVPTDAEFALPAGYSSVAFPKSDANLSLTINNFNSLSEVYLVLMNRASTNLTPGWSVTRQTASLRASTLTMPPSATSPTAQQRFHLWLREQKNRLPKAQVTQQLSLRQSLRAVAVNDQLPFTAYLDPDYNELTPMVKTTFNATCVKVVAIPGTAKNTCFFVDNQDLAVADMANVIDGVGSAWLSIYAKNREIFGAEPEGTLNGIAVDDFYVLISRRIFTAGYFYGGDLYPPSTTGVDYSNEKKILYMQYPTSSISLSHTTDRLASTLAHEFQHMIHFFQNIELETSAYWLDEAMSGYAEWANGYRIENGKSQSKALLVQDYLNSPASVSLANWQGSNENYGMVFLFGVWLAQNYGSAGSVQKLVAAAREEKLAVEYLTGEPFAETFAKFMLALLVDDDAGGTFGFATFSLNAEYSFSDGLSSVTLSGPRMTTVDFTGATSGSTAVSPYAAAFIKISGGTGTSLSVSATLPSGSSLFQLKKN